MTTEKGARDRVTMNENGALLFKGRMVCRLVYGDDALKEALRQACEDHMNGKEADDG